MIQSLIIKWIIYIAIAASVIGGAFYLTHKITTLEKEVSDKTINIKSLEAGMSIYEDKNGTLHTQTIQMQESMDELKASKDSTTKALMDSVKRWRIKASTVTDIGQVKQDLNKTTVIHYAPGSYTQKDTSYDFSTLPYIVNKVSFTHDSATNFLHITDTESLVWHDHKETVDPPSKFFLFRWFQKKQWVNQVDIVHQNPYIHTTAQKFVHVNK